MADPPGVHHVKSLTQSQSTGTNSRPSGSIPPLVQQTKTRHARLSSSRASISHLTTNPSNPSFQPSSSGAASGYANNATPDRVHFHSLAHGVVKSRQGSVLSRGSLLKTDYFASGIYPYILFYWFSSCLLWSSSSDWHVIFFTGRAQSLTHHLQGAPNFRSASYNIFGVRNLGFILSSWCSPV
jgi:hypothetical protein